MQKIIFVFILLVFPVSAFTAELFFVPGTIEMGVGESVNVEIFLKSDEEINALEGTLLSSSEYLEPEEAHDGNSILTLWLKKPVSNDLSFAGAIPGGFRGERGRIFSVRFTAKKIGQTELAFTDAKAFQNDGTGTEADLKTSSLPISVVNTPTLGEQEEQVDTDPPEPFELEVARDSSLFNGKWFLVFTTQDKGFGIARYEVAEGDGGREGEKWVVAESPYLLTDQTLRSDISVRAIDKAGNERLAQLPATNPPPWYANYFVWSILIVIALLCAAAYLRYSRHSFGKFREK